MKTENMVVETPIMCPHCHKDTGMTTEGLMFYCITHDLTCPHCGEVVIKANRVTY